MFAIEIPRRSGYCAKGQEKLLPGMSFYSALWEGEGTSAYIRQDFCPDCWSLAAQCESFKKIRSYWKSKLSAKCEPSMPLERDERALYLLKDALTRDSLEDQAEAFILALYLARKRLLILRNDSCPTLLYEVPATEEMLGVRKLALDALQTKKIQQNLAIKFSQNE